MADIADIDFYYLFLVNFGFLIGDIEHPIPACTSILIENDIG